jgi:hypothetical protein
VHRHSTVTAPSEHHRSTIRAPSEHHQSTTHAYAPPHLPYASTLRVLQAESGGVSGSGGGGVVVLGGEEVGAAVDELGAWCRQRLAHYKVCVCVRGEGCQYTY